MIRVFSPTDKIFESNGDTVLKPYKAKVRKEDNSSYYLDLETPLEYVDYLVQGNIIVAPTPTGDQAFRVDNVTRTGSKLTTRAWHVFYDSERYFLRVHPDGRAKTCDAELKYINGRLMPDSEFTVSSDITDEKVYDTQRISFYTAISNLLTLYGGHIVRNNFDIQIRESIETDHGITIEYSKNLKEITVEENWDDVATTLFPIGKDGITLDYLEETDPYLYADIEYDIPYVKAIQFDQDISEDDFKDADGNVDRAAYLAAIKADLRLQGQAYLEVHCVPEISYKLKAHLDKVSDLGDVILVKDKRLKLELLTSVTGFEYDCLTERFTEIDFGNFARTLTGFADQINERLKALGAGLNAVSNETTNQQTNYGFEFEEGFTAGTGALKPTITKVGTSVQLSGAIEVTEDQLSSGIMCSIGASFRPLTSVQTFGIVGAETYTLTVDTQGHVRWSNYTPQTGDVMEISVTYLCGV